ncbi:hypothetical protein P7K49_002413 [Saguinus oedipus]|uniref:Rrp7 RRM-like N-terminal domain-containing protein n=1 Tax=Saguinus oedipus TaxID=9490 RepID=A0ABQ9WL73_SAGOE|nr:hypothetical protein P7K49_002413 [Saguinus oedipus]
MSGPGAGEAGLEPGRRAWSQGAVQAPWKCARAGAEPQLPATPALPGGKMVARRKKRAARDSEDRIPSPSGYIAIPIKFSKKQQASHYLYVRAHSVREGTKSTWPWKRTLFVLNVPPYCTEAPRVDRCGSGLESFRGAGTLAAPPRVEGGLGTALWMLTLSFPLATAGVPVPPPVLLWPYPVCGVAGQAGPGREPEGAKVEVISSKASSGEPPKHGFS